jgi:hypothetical protein
LKLHGPVRPSDREDVSMHLVVVVPARLHVAEELLQEGKQVVALEYARSGWRCRGDEPPRHGLPVAFKPLPQLLGCLVLVLLRSLPGSRHVLQGRIREDGADLLGT